MTQPTLDLLDVTPLQPGWDAVINANSGSGNSALWTHLMGRPLAVRFYATTSQLPDPSTHLWCWVFDAEAGVPKFSNGTAWVEASVFNAKQFGAAGDGKMTTGAEVESGLDTVTRTGAFVSADTGKTIIIDRAGTSGLAHVAVMTYVNANQVTIDPPAATAISGVRIVWGTDDTSALQAAFTAAAAADGSGGDSLSPSGRSLVIPRGIYVVSDELVVGARLNVYGEGYGTLLAAATPTATKAVLRLHDASGFLPLTDVHDLRVLNLSGTGVRAIDQMNVLRCNFYNLIMHCRRVALDYYGAYPQGASWWNIDSVNPGGATLRIRNQVNPIGNYTIGSNIGYLDNVRVLNSVRADFDATTRGHIELIGVNAWTLNLGHVEVAGGNVPSLFMFYCHDLTITRLWNEANTHAINFDIVDSRGVYLDDLGTIADRQCRLRSSEVFVKGFTTPANWDVDDNSRVHYDHRVAEGNATEGGQQCVAQYRSKKFHGRTTTARSYSQGLVTVTTASPHGYSNNDHIAVWGANQPGYDGTYAITVTGASTFTLLVNGNPETPATGTMLARKGTDAPVSISSMVLTTPPDRASWSTPLPGLATSGNVLLPNFTIRTTGAATITYEDDSDNGPCWKIVVTSVPTYLDIGVLNLGPSREQPPEGGWYAFEIISNTVNTLQVWTAVNGVARPFIPQVGKNLVRLDGGNITSNAQLPLYIGCFNGTGTLVIRDPHFVLGWEYNEAVQRQIVQFTGGRRIEYSRGHPTFGRYEEGSLVLEQDYRTVWVESGYGQTESVINGYKRKATGTTHATSDWELIVTPTSNIRVLDDPLPFVIKSDYLLFDFDASRLGLKDGEVVKQLTDFAQGRHFTQSNGDKWALFRRTGSGMLIGLDSVEFDGGDDAYTLTDGTFNGIDGGEGVTYFSVLRRSGSSPTTSGETGRDDFTTAGDGDHYPFTNGTIFDGTFSDARKTCGNPSTISKSLWNWHILTVRSLDNDWEMKIDGVSLFSTGTNNYDAPTTMRIGQSFGNPYFAGWLSRLMIFTPLLTSGDETSVTNYLKAKYGIS